MSVSLDLVMFLSIFTLVALCAGGVAVTCSLVVYEWREAMYCRRRRDRRLRLKAALARHTATASLRS